MAPGTQHWATWPVTPEQLVSTQVYAQAMLARGTRARGLRQAGVKAGDV